MKELKRRRTPRAEERAAEVATLVVQAAAAKEHGRRQRARLRTFLGLALDLHSARIRALGRTKSGPPGRPDVGKAKVEATGRGFYIEHRHRDVRQGFVRSEGFFCCTVAFSLPCIYACSLLVSHVMLIGWTSVHSVS